MYSMEVWNPNIPTRTSEFLVRALYIQFTSHITVLTLLCTYRESNLSNKHTTSSKEIDKKCMTSDYGINYLMCINSTTMIMLTMVQNTDFVFAPDRRKPVVGAEVVVGA